jgi:hypothetical protein
MIKPTILIILLIPTLTLAQQYEDAAGTSQMLADTIGDYWDFVFTDTPSMIQRFLAFAVEWAVKIQMYIFFESVKMSWGISKAIIENFGVMSQITAQLTLLPQDVRQVIVESRLFDALNLVLNAYVTRFVMRFV